MAKAASVQRPRKRGEFSLVFASNQAQKGWRDLAATIRGPLADTWDFLTRTPQRETPQNYPLKGELGTVVRNHRTHVRWQHKPTARGDARIWFYVEAQTVHIEQVHTSHPQQTK